MSFKATQRMETPMKIDQNALNDIDIAIKADDRFILARVLDSHPEFASPDYESSVAPYLKKAISTNPELGKMMISSGIGAQLAGPEHSATVAKMFGGNPRPSQKQIHPDSAQRIADLQLALRSDDEIIASRVLSSAPWLANKEFSQVTDNVLAGAFKNGNGKMVSELAGAGILGDSLSPETLNSLKGNKLAMEHFGKLAKDAKSPDERKIRQLQLALLDPATSDHTLAAINAPEPEPAKPAEVTVAPAPAPELPEAKTVSDPVVAAVAADIVKEARKPVAGNGPDIGAVAKKSKFKPKSPKAEIAPMIP